MKKLNKYWFHILIVLSIMVCLFSCDIQKKAIKNKENRTVSELQERTIKRKGDTVTYTIPKVILKDTTIYTVNEQGTTLRTVYNRSGNISEIECFSSLIEITERLERMTAEVIKQKDSEKTEDFDSSFILYGFIGLAVIIAVVAFFFFRFLSQNTRAMNKVLERL